MFRGVAVDLGDKHRLVLALAVFQARVPDFKGCRTGLPSVSSPDIISHSSWHERSLRKGRSQIGAIGSEDPWLDR